jgi:hypothetical protein
MNEYSPTEATMIICMTRERNCTPERCLKGPCWMKDEARQELQKQQAEYEAQKRKGKER